MDAIFIDRNGNKKNFLYQYDKGQYFKINNFPYSTAPVVYFSVKSIPVSLPIQSTLTDSTIYAFIPNDLLTIGEDITAYVYIDNGAEGHVTESAFISVCPRKRPSDYVDSGDMPDIPDHSGGPDSPITPTGSPIYYGTYITTDEYKIPYLRDMTLGSLNNNSMTFTINAYRDNEYMYFFAAKQLGDLQFQTGTFPGGWHSIGTTTVMSDGVSVAYTVYKTDWDKLGEVTWNVTVI